jgi:predicted DNA-binding transcriptional regulator YafY
MIIDYLCPIVSPSDIKNTTMPLAKNAFERYKIIDRHLRRNKGLTARELTEIVNNELYQFERESNPDHSLEVSERMIRLDIKKMPEIFPVEIINRNGRFYYESSEDSIDNINITEQDKTAITLAMGVFARFKGTPLFDQFSDAVTRILASSVLRKINTTDTQKYIQVAEVSDSSGIEWLERIYNAIIEKKTLKLHYKNFGEQPSIRSISPYMLKEYRNKWYLIAYVHDISKSEKILLHRLNRILNIEESNAEYINDKTFDGKKYFKYTLGVFHKHGEEPIHVKLKLHGKHIIKLISEDRIHNTQEFIPLSADEALVHLTVYDSPELKTFILSHGENIEVLEPKFLRDSIMDSLKKSLSHYN